MLESEAAAARGAAARKEAEMKVLLRQMGDGDPAALQPFDHPEYWRALAEGLHISADGESPIKATGSTLLNATSET